MGTRQLRFSGVDHISSLSWPHGESFPTADGRKPRIYGLSGLALVNSSREAPLTLFAVCDRSAVLSAEIYFDFETLELASLTWINHWGVVSRKVDNDVVKHLDVEGIAVMPGGEVLLSAEPHPIYRLPRWQSWSDLGGPLPATPLPQQMPSYILAGIGRNLGFEALTALPRASVTTTTSSGIIVVGLEGSLAQDAPSVRRLFELNAATGEILRQAVLVISAREPMHLLAELQALDSGGLTNGGMFLALERSWGLMTGNDIRLYMLHATGVDDVSHCRAIVSDQMAMEGSRAGPSHCQLDHVLVMHKQLLLRWSKDSPLTDHLAVDNYEGMAIVPPAAFRQTSWEDMGGVMLLLVNDNNDNPAQIGTQLVLLRLAFDAPRAKGATEDAVFTLEDQTGRANIAWQWLLIALPALLLLVCWLARRFSRRAWQELDKQDQQEEQEDDAVAELQHTASSQGAGALQWPVIARAASSFSSPFPSARNVQMMQFSSAFQV